MNLVERNNWLKLYDIEKEIQELKSWEYLTDMDLLQYMSDKYGDVFYFAIMGNSGITKAIAVYNCEQIVKLFDAMKSDFPPYLFLNYQECLMCNFDVRDNVSKDNKELIKDLGLKFRGTWVYFENFEKGYLPSMLSEEQVKIMIDALSNLYVMLKEIKDKKLEIDFENGKTLIRCFDDDKKEYVNIINQIMIPNREFDIFKFDVQESKRFKFDMSKIPQSNVDIEFDFLNYFPAGIKEFKEDDGRCYLPKLRVIAEHKTGFVHLLDWIDKNEYENEEEYIEESLDILFDFFGQCGRPRTIYVRDIEAKAILKEFMDLAKVKIVVNSNLKAIDNCLLEFINMNN